MVGKKKKRKGEEWRTDEGINAEILMAHTKPTGPSHTGLRLIKGAMPKLLMLICDLIFRCNHSDKQG